VNASVLLECRLAARLANPLRTRPVPPELLPDEDDDPAPSFEVVDNCDTWGGGGEYQTLFYINSTRLSICVNLI